MRKLITIVIAGLFSSVAFADSSYEERLDYKCNFEGKPTCGDNCHDRKVSCWVEGTLCNEITGSNEGRHCRGGEDPILIKCSDGFSLFSKDAAVEIDNGTLWINADQYREKIATLRVDGFYHNRGSDYDFKRLANLLYSNDKGDAQELDGICHFEKRGGHS